MHPSVLLYWSPEVWGWIGRRGNFDSECHFIIPKIKPVEENENEEQIISPVLDEKEEEHTPPFAPELSRKKPKSTKTHCWLTPDLSPRLRTAASNRCKTVTRKQIRRRPDRLRPRPQDMNLSPLPPETLTPQLLIASRRTPPRVPQAG